MPKPAIFIPGFPASELLDKETKATVYPPSPAALLNMPALIAKMIDIPGSLIAGAPIPTLAAGLVPEAASLYAILRDEFGYDVGPASNDFLPIGWDWRQSVDSDDTVDRITRALDKLSPAKSGNVVAILHSTGGLVFRAFLEKKPEYTACFEQVLTFGIPWCGTLEALHAVTVGGGINILGIPIVSAAQAVELVSHAQAAYDLFPRCADMNLFVADGVSTTPIDNRTWITQGFMNALCDAAHPRFPQQFDDLPLTNVCGWGGQTWTVATVVGGTLTFLPTSKEYGDGTVPFISSSWLQGRNVRSMFVPIGAYVDDQILKVHGQLWAPKAARQLFREIFEDAPRAPFIAAAADSDQYIDPRAATIRIRVAAMDAQGLPLPDCTVSFPLGPRTQTESLKNKKQIDIDMPREAFQQVATNSIRRTELRIQWTGGGPVTVPVSIQIS